MKQINLKFGFTLVELVIVILLIGILASVGVVNYFARRDKAIENEARVILQLICAAEKDIRETTGQYRGCNDTASCNQALGLSIPSDPRQIWNYTVTDQQDNFEGRANRRNANVVMSVFFIYKDCVIRDSVLLRLLP